jgi:ADP-heptose:LPS heptosyltransferase
MAPALRQTRYRAVINLSHREDALRLAGSLQTEQILGPYRTEDGENHIAGDWQLYRASLIHNNRHNLYHWADLNSLDLTTPYQFAATRWPEPRAAGKTSSAHIGLFLGASEADKRPQARFWVTLARLLLAAGHRPVLLGGDAERQDGRAVAAELGAPALDLCGRFSIRELSEFIAGLDLMVTPDTGPMHVAAWTGTPTLNLSMGPVNAWETGPFSPGHLILRTRLSCIGCWRCTRPRTFCKETFAPGRVAALAHAILSAGETDPAAAVPPGQELLRTARDKWGLYALRSVAEGAPPPRMAVSRFWQACFGHSFGLLPADAPDAAARRLAEDNPRLAPVLSAGLATLCRHLSLGLRGKTTANGPAVTDEAFWAAFPPLLRPFSGFTHLLLQNGNFSRRAFARGVALAEGLAAVLEKAVR